MQENQKTRSVGKGDKSLSPPPSRMSGAERRRQILEIAIVVFSEKGFSGATTKEIAQRAKINESLIFRHFSGKDALYDAILEEHSCEEKYARSWHKLIACANSRDDFRVFTTAAKFIIERKTSDREFIRVLIYGILENRNSVAKMLEEQLRPLKDFLVEYIERRQKDKIFRRTDPLPIVNAFIGMTMHHMMTGEMLCRAQYGDAEIEEVAVFARIILADLRSSDFEKAN